MRPVWRGETCQPVQNNYSAGMKANRLSGLLLFLILIATAFRLSARAGEPSSNGKPLSEWLLALEEGHTGSGERVEASDAQAAIRQIGTNGIPTLVDLLGVYDDWSAKRVLSKLHNKDLTAYFKWDENPDSRAKNLRKLGLNGFSILGTNAESAAPQITKALSYSDEAARALTLIGPKGFSALTNAINDSNSSVRDAIIRALGKEGGGDPEVIKQLLVNALKDPCTLIRLHAADILRDKAPDAVIATLMPLLDVGDYGQRQSVADALADYGPAGKSAAPMFLYGNCLSAADTLGAMGPAAKIAAPKLFSVFTNVALGTNKYLVRCLSGTLLGDLRVIDPDTATKAEDFILNGGPLGVVDLGWTDTLLPNGKELIAGGFFQTKVPVNINPTWFKTSSSPARSDIQARIPTKTAYAFSRAQLFDPVTGKRTETGSMNVVRGSHAAILLRNGKVLVAGGHNFRDDGKLNDLSSAELFDPVTGKWTETGSMNAPCAGGEMVLQHNGKVLFHEELYDPATGTWTVVTNK